MCRLVRLSIAAVTISTFAVPAFAQTWNPLAKKSPPQAAQPTPNSQPQPNSFSTFNPFSNVQPVSLNKMLTIPNLMQPSTRPSNQPSMKDRFQATTHRMWEDTKRAVTPPILQNRGQGAGGKWPFTKTQKTGFSIPNIFKASAPAPQGPPPTLQEWLAQPRPE